MKSLKDFSKYLDDFTNKMIENTIKEQEQIAEQIWSDVVENAPYKTGEYISSIGISPTTNNNGKITTFIGSDMWLAPTKWTGGKRYNLGFLLEHGTFQHAIPNAFGKGFYYGYVGSDGRYHKGTLDKDWHPGTIAQPHYLLALEKNKKLYKGKMHIAFEKSIKEAK